MTAVSGQEQLFAFPAASGPVGAPRPAKVGAKSGWRVPAAGDAVVGVLPFERGVDQVFDYVVPADLARANTVRIGTRVRMDLRNRRVGGWVVRTDGPRDVSLAPIRKISGDGPSPEVVDLCRWAAWRWAGRWASMLREADPVGLSPRALGSGGDESRPRSRPTSVAPWLPALVADFRSHPVSTVVWPPGIPVGDLLAALSAPGRLIVAAASVAQGRAIVHHLRRVGVNAVSAEEDWWSSRFATAVGARSAVFAPTENPVAVVVVDEHDERHTAEGSPTWNSRELAIERARRHAVPCVLVSPTPSVDAVAAGHVVRVPRDIERRGWPSISVIDVSDADPRRRHIPDAATALLRADGPVVAIASRLGRARLLACRNCRHLAECEACGAAVELVDEGFHCPRCGTDRPSVCLACHATRFVTLKAGVQRWSEEISAVLGEPVTTVTASSRAGAAADPHRVIVGTEAALFGVGMAKSVVFLDLDGELFAPRYRAAEHVLGMVGRAARLVAPVHGAVGIVTREPHHRVLSALQRRDPLLAMAEEAAMRRQFHMPPFSTLVEIGGAAGAAFMERLGEVDGAEVATTPGGTWIIRSDRRDELLDRLSAVERPPGRLRLRVDPAQL